MEARHKDPSTDPPTFCVGASALSLASSASPGSSDQFRPWVISNPGVGKSGANRGNNPIVKLLTRDSRKRVPEVQPGSHVPQSRSSGLDTASEETGSRVSPIITSSVHWPI